MKKIFTVLLLAFICICGYAQTIDPVLLDEMGQRSDNEKIRVVVIMKSQYDRQQLGRRAAYYTTRADRREFVVSQLKQFAEASQYDLRNTLSEMERHDMTSAPKILWMANALYFSATKQAINELAMRRDIEIIGFDEEKYVLFDEETTPAGMTRSITSNVTQVNANRVWDLGYTGQGVVVAVIDTGVNYNHLDLADHLWDGGDDYPNHGYDFYNDDNDPMDDHSHGTHCAGTVCGDGTAGQQTGMAPDATLMCVKVLSSGGGGSVSITCDGMQWAVEHGCDLFSMSLGWANSSITERTLFRNTCVAVLDAGVVGAIAAGNEGDEQSSYPIPNNVRVPGSCPPPYMDPIQESNSGGLSCSICVGAVDSNDAAAYFTSQGPVTWSNTDFADYPYTSGSNTEFGLIRPDVCAPGVSIVSADYSNNSGYTTKSGTSMATPCVAGCISLLLSKNIDATPAEICQVLEETAVPLTEGKSNIYGFGRVDVLAAINALYLGPLTLESVVVDDEQGNNDGKLNAGEAVTLDVTLTNASDVALDGATIILSTDSEYVTITNGTATLPHFNAGQTRTIDDLFAFTLSPQAPTNRTIQFMAETFVNGESLGTMRFNVMVYGYILKFDEVTVLNDNNGNGSLEPGETANLHVVISNIGNELAHSVIGTLSETYPYLTINNAVGTFGDIDANGQASADFNVTLAGNAPETYTIDFSLDLVDAYNSHSEIDFVLGRKAITITANPANGGTVSGGGYYMLGQTCTITATVNTGYVFINWTKDGEELSSGAEYTFTVNSDMNLVANFTEGIMIGDGGTTTSPYLPSNSYYNYSLSQQIYTPEDLGSAGIINSIAFYNGGIEETRKYDLYLKTTTKNTFSGTSDWEIVSASDKVFSGVVTMVANAWTFITFDTPYAYDGITNLVLVADDNTGSWEEGMACRVFNASGSQSIRIFSDGTNYDPYSPSSYTGTLLSVKNQLIITKDIPSGESFTVTVSANPAEAGTVSGGGEFNFGQTCTVIATPADDYYFMYWSQNGQVVSTNASYSFGVTSDRDLVANFTTGLTVTVSANPVAGGTVSGGGEYGYGQSCTVIATPADGYLFTDWTQNGTPISSSASYTFNVTSDMNLVANFTEGIMIGDGSDTKSNYLPAYSYYTHSLTEQIYTSAELGEAGVITSIAFYNGGAEKTLDYDFYLKSTTKSTFSSNTDWITVSNSDKVFSGSVIMAANAWTTIPLSTPFDYDGKSNVVLVTNKNTYWTNSPHMSCRVFNASNQAIYVYSDNTEYDPLSPPTSYGSGEYYALFSQKNQLFVSKETSSTEPIHITVSINPELAGTVSGGGEYTSGETCTIVATPNEGYSFVNWTQNGTEVSTETTYTFTVNEDATFVANFALNSYTVTATPNIVEGGSVTVSSNRNRDELFYDFEDGTTQDWTILQGPNGDSPNNWRHSSTYDEEYSTGHGHNATDGFMLSESYLIEGEGSVHPDNYLVSPQILLGGSIHFWATNVDNGYAEHFAVAVSTTGNNDASCFSTVQEWTFAAKAEGTGGTRSLNNGIWYEYTVDLSAFVGLGYVAIHHFNCYDQWLLCVDDITIVEGEPYTGAVSSVFNHGESCAVTAIPNEGYIFVNWTEDEEIVSTDAAYTFTVTGDRDLVANFEATTPTIQQTIEFVEGWNWWTPYVDLDGEELLTQLKQGLGANGISITDQSGASLNYHSIYGWGGTLTSLQVGKMYQIQIGTACTVTLIGTAINPADHSITLTYGPNWIGFYGTQSMSVNAALVNLDATAGDEISAQDGTSATYSATYGWGGLLQTLVPGQAYIYNSKASQSQTFTFPAE